MLTYTLVVEGPSPEDATSWVLTNIDTGSLVISQQSPSVFMGHWIFKLAGSLDAYNKMAFEASLNHEMRDLGSGLVWWNVRFHSTEENAA